jgi:hypothetical protein
MYLGRRRNIAMREDRIERQEPATLSEEALALVVGGSYRARSEIGGFVDGTTEGPVEQ